MSTLELFEMVMAVREKGDCAAVATIIRTKGSTPRETGAKMLIYSDGKIVGTIGGGCGESEVIEKAFIVMEKGKPMHHQVDLTAGLMYEDGGICGGIMDVLIEPVI